MLKKVCLLAYPRVLKQLENYSLYGEYKKHEETTTDINFHIKHNDISKVALNTGKIISNNDYGESNTTKINAEC